MHPVTNCGSIPVAMVASISSEQIRELRGSASRAAFAKRLGVTGNTIYRWELPEDAQEARRPRGAELDKLLRLLRGAGVEAPVESERVTAAATPRASADDLTAAWLSVERVLNGEPRRGQNELVQLMATNRNLSVNARALSAFGIALSEVVLT